MYSILGLFIQYVIQNLTLCHLGWSVEGGSRISMTEYSCVQHTGNFSSDSEHTLNGKQNFSETILTCKICFHTWKPKNSSLYPQRCPKCRSTRWNISTPVNNTCMRCGHKWVSNGKEPTKCPSCHSSKWNMKSFRCVCKKCGHVWYKKKNGTPKKCPFCKSYYWNVPQNIFLNNPSLIFNNDSWKWTMTPYRKELFGIMNSECSKSKKIESVAKLLNLTIKESEVYLMYMEGSNLVSVSIACDLPFEIAMNIIQDVECVLFSSRHRMEAHA